jgi:cyclin-dependent kinase regulatory subunit CKS1
MPHYPEEIEYSEKYSDCLYEYRHVILPKELYKKLPKGKLLSENEWRSLGVQQSRGWIHYDIHKPEPHILLFRRPLGTDAQTGIAPSDILLKIKQYEESLFEVNNKNN